MKERGTPYARRQLALRRLLLDGRGKLTPDARVALGALRRMCHAAPNQQLLRVTAAGVDPIATVAAAARREVWDKIVHTLNLDDYEVTNLREED